jgi:RHS repeat-associated protein
MTATPRGKRFGPALPKLIAPVRKSNGHAFSARKPQGRGRARRPTGVTFAYNAARELSSITPSGGSAQALSYGGAGQDDLVGVGSSTTLQNSLLGLTREVSSAGTSYYARTSDGMLIDQRTASGKFNPVYDAQGDVIALVSTAGKVEWTFHYGPYGENVKSEGMQTIPYPFGYKGGYRMPGGNKGEGNVTNALLHFGQRYYDPTTGRWTQRDPLNQVSNPIQADRYLFAATDPVNQSDASGLSIGSDCAKGAVGGAIAASEGGLGAAAGGAIGGCGVSVGIDVASEIFGESEEEEEEYKEEGEILDVASNLAEFATSE